MKRWLRELKLDLATADRSGYFRPDPRPWGLVYNKTVGIPAVGQPNLLYFPPPYHPLEVVASLRGYGGLRHGDRTRPQEGARDVVIGRALAGPGETFSYLGRWLFWTPAQACLAAHLLTPFDVPWRYKSKQLVAVRNGVGVPFRVAGAKFDGFWKLVDPEWGELV